MSNTVHPIFEPVIAAARGAAEQAHDSANAAKHTPGPWRAEPATTKAGKAVLCIGASNKRLFDMRAWNDEDYANARLIAAAPDMLAALQFVLPSLRGAYKEDSDWSGDVAKVEAAIARATGGEG